MTHWGPSESGDMYALLTMNCKSKHATRLIGRTETRTNELL